MRRDRCETCRYWQPNDRQPDPDSKWGNQGTWGQCRRRSPAPLVTGDEVAFWPTTNGEDWCGDHREQDQHRRAS